jgi:PKD repeat protein
VVTSPQTFTGLTPGVAYDVLVADTCGNDTSSYASVTGSVANSPLPVAASTSTLQVATLTGQTVDFNGTASTAGAGATYAWDYGDGNTGTGVTSSHTYTANGTYNACLVIVDGCGSDTTCQQIVIEEISLTENLLSRSLEVFPNPAKDVVNVTFTAVGDANVNIIITDAQGRAIMNISDKLGGTTYQKALDVSKLASGVYMIKVTSGDLVAMRRVSIGK